MACLFIVFLVVYVHIHIAHFDPYQYDSVNHNSTGNVQSPPDWLIGYEDQNQWLCTCTRHSQVHPGVASVVNTKPMMSIALIVDNHMHIIVAVVIYDTAICCLSPSTVSRCSYTNTCSLCDVAATSKTCRDDQMVTQSDLRWHLCHLLTNTSSRL